jgi:AcrR family transcriptional regulator
MADGGRPTWSRTLLIDTAVELLREGGPDAVTVGAVTASAQMSRATLYRQFPGCSEVLAAAFGELIPAPATPAATGSWQDRLIAVLVGHAQAVADRPLIVTAMCWLSVGAGRSGLADAFATEAVDSPQRNALRNRIGAWCIAPIDDVLASPPARDELGEVDRDLVFALLIAPVVFGRSTRPQVCAAAAVAAFSAAHTERSVDQAGGNT